MNLNKIKLYTLLLILLLLSPTGIQAAETGNIVQDGTSAPKIEIQVNRPYSQNFNIQNAKNHYEIAMQRFLQTNVKSAYVALPTPFIRPASVNATYAFSLPFTE